MDKSTKCDIVSVGKRRDGGTRYWCSVHRADATAKYGKRAKKCRYSHIQPPKTNEILDLDINNYKGGIGIWGAVPPIYDTTKQEIDSGIHVHAREETGQEKEIDSTYRHVNITGFPKTLFSDQLVISELDAIYFMVSSIFGFEMKYIECTYCGYPHLDKDWFSVHPHKRHLCAGCGKHFTDTEVAIGNPIMGIRKALNIAISKPTPTIKTLNIKQKDFPEGIRIWGSNPAIIWKSSHKEEKGIHVHTFEANEVNRIDDTYSNVTIDGIKLNEDMVRIFMAQNALPHIKRRVVNIDCSNCKKSHFDTGHHRFTPHITHTCEHCGNSFKSSGRLRKVIGNPICSELEKLSTMSINKPQIHNIGLLEETP